LSKHARLATVALAALLAAGAALASKAIGVKITGQVTAVSGTEAITINGTQYFVKAGSAAAQALSQITPGEVVDAILDGPAESSTSHVVVVHVHQAQ
jgi:hypothetical protein